MLITQTLVLNILEFDYVIDVVDIGSDYVTLCSIVYDVSFLVWTCISGNNDDILLLLYAKILMWYFCWCEYFIQILRCPDPLRQLVISNHDIEYAVFLLGKFQRPTPNQCPELINNEYKFLCFHKSIQHIKAWCRCFGFDFTLYPAMCDWCLIAYVQNIYLKVNYTYKSIYIYVYMTKTYIHIH